MSLLSAKFLLFLLIVGGLHWLGPRRWRPWSLLAASLAFYAAWSPRLAALLVAAVLVNHAVVHELTIAGPARSPARRLAVLRVGIVFQCLLLFAFKYLGFFLDGAGSLLDALGWHVPELTLQIVAPLGLSYVCLKSIAIIAEAHGERLAGAPTLVQHAVYLLFFPSLTAGPIDRPRPFLEQLRTIEGARMADSLRRGGDLVFSGLVKKVVIADHLGVAVERAFAGNFASPTDAALAAVTYAFYIYADFSGYTDLARGIAACLGFDLAVNFRTPYAAGSPSEFWQRWHMSLSSWLRDYVFLPLGGAFRSRAQAYRNLVLTMLIAGLWHGASWMYLLWGLYFGLLLVGHRALQPSLKRLRRRLHLRGRPRQVIEVGLTFSLVCVGWLIFRANDPGQLASAFSTAHGWSSPHWPGLLRTVLPLAALLLAVERLGGPGPDPRFLRGSVLPWWSKPIALAAAAYAVFVLGSSTQSFVYAQF